MNQPGNFAMSFVVRIWLEKRETADAAPELRGWIEHTSSGTNQYFVDLADIRVFITGYVKKWGVNPDQCVYKSKKLWGLIPKELFKRYKVRRT